MVRPALGRGPLPYALLLGSLLAAAVTPLDAVLSSTGPVGVVVFYCSPLACAGVIFASSFAATPYPLRALASSVVGSVLGGFLELSSFVVG